QGRGLRAVRQRSLVRARCHLRGQDLGRCGELGLRTQSLPWSADLRVRLRRLPTIVVCRRRALWDHVRMPHLSLNRRRPTERSSRRGYAQLVSAAAFSLAVACSPEVTSDGHPVLTAPPKDAAPVGSTFEASAPDSACGESSGPLKTADAIAMAKRKGDKIFT